MTDLITDEMVQKAIEAAYNATPRNRPFRLLLAAERNRLEAQVRAALTAALGAMKPVAWRYELAAARVWTNGKPTGWENWNWHLTDFEPCIPEGAIRNLTPLFALPTPPSAGE